MKKVVAALFSRKFQNFWKVLITLTSLAFLSQLLYITTNVKSKGYLIQQPLFNSTFFNVRILQH